MDAWTIKCDFLMFFHVEQFYIESGADARN